jgi:hypothetical protein
MVRETLLADEMKGDLFRTHGRIPSDGLPPGISGLGFDPIAHAASCPSQFS